MNSRIAQLESLLERVQTRAAEPRTGVAKDAVTAAPVVGEPSELDSDEAEEAAESLSAPLGHGAMGAAARGAPDLDEPGSELPEARDDEVEDVDEDVIEFSDPVEELDDAVEEIEDVDLDLDEPLPESGEVRAQPSGLALDERPITQPPESTLSSSISQDRNSPTIEQVGQTVPLEEGEAADFELDEPAVSEAKRKSDSPLEMDIPSTPPKEKERLPESAREELERHRLGETTPLQARTSVRPVLSTNVVDLLSAAKDFEPKSFVELLDASLKL